MARKPKEKPEVELWQKAAWVGFVNIKLNQAEKDSIKQMLLTPESIAQFFQDAAAAGYKVGLSYSIAEDVYTVSLTGQYQRKPNPGLTASIRHRDFDVAVTAMWFVVGEDGYAIDWQERYGSVSNDNW